MIDVIGTANMARRGGRRENVQVTRVDREGLTEFYFCVRPCRDVGGIEAQAKSVYQNLFDALQAQGASHQDLITEKLLFSKADPRFQALATVRQGAYRGAGCYQEMEPAVTFLHQDPGVPGRQCELQAYAVAATSAEGVRVRSVDGMPGSATGRIVEAGGLKHIHLSGLTGIGDSCTSSGFDTQAKRMFERAETCLQQEGISFQDVVRTWIYIADLAGDYAAFNPVRTAFFKRQGIRRIPASTGIQGGTLNPSVGCMLDLYALQADRPVRIEPMRSPTMNEAPSYGSSFSRGMTVASEEQTVVYVSGTASIDQQGQVFCEGDIEGQVNRMLQNVAALLHGQGASFDDVVTAITYLKRPDFLETFYGVWDVCGLPADIPNTVSIADVCRPEWLCEIEVIAVLPGGPVLS